MDPIRFGKYFLTEMIASGGMAEIYKAMIKTSDGHFHSLAIKRILPQFSKDEEFISLLTDEAKVMVFMNHPNIVSIVEFGKVEGSYYIAMEYVDGATLQSLYRKVRESGDQMPIHLALYIVREIASGLAYAHRKTDSSGNSLNLVHRDISPGNILLSHEGEIKITDFGISKVATQNHETQIGVIRGKTGYMSPEQTRAGMNIDSRTDLYALGIILFELITGERLFKADSVPQALKMIREGKIPAPRQLRPEVPMELQEIILKALAQDPNQRYQTGEELGDAINEFLTKYYSGQKLKRVTHTDLVEFMSKYFLVTAKEDRMAMKENEEKTLSNKEYDSKQSHQVYADGPSSKVYAVNPLFAIEAQEDKASMLKKKEHGTESLVDAPQGSVNAPEKTGKAKSRIIFLTVLLLMAVAGWLAWQKFETEIMELIKPSEISVTIESEPEGAKITIDQQEISRTTPTVVKLIRGSQVQIILSKEGFQRVAKLVSVDQNTSTVKFELVAEKNLAQANSASVTIQSEPPGASVFVNNELVEQKTPYEFSVEVGKPVSVRLELPGYKSKSTTIQMEKSEKLVKNIILVKESTEKQPPKNTIPKSKLKVNLPSLGQKPTKQNKKINLSVNTTPWSEVFVDGVKIGISPFVGARVSQGKHKLRFVNNQLKIKPYEVTVNFTADDEVRCIYDLNTYSGGCK